MIVLGIETSSTVGGIAILDDEKLLASRTFESGLVHGREIAPAIKSASDEAGVPPGKLDLIAVDIGPGSYTGVRVGVAAAKMMAWALGTKLAAVVSLDALANAAASLGERIVPILDARRKQLYAAEYAAGPNGVSAVKRLSIVPREGFLETVTRPAVLIGDAIGKFPELFAESPGISHAPKEFWIPEAATVARLGLEAAARGELADPVTLEPLYLRPSEAEEKFGVRVNPSDEKPENRN